MKESSRMVAEKIKKRKKLKRINDEARKEGTRHVLIAARKEILQSGASLDLESNADPTSSMHM